MDAQRGLNEGSIQIEFVLSPSGKVLGRSPNHPSYSGVSAPVSNALQIVFF